MIHLLLLSVTSDGTLSFWDTAEKRQSGAQAGEYFIDLILTPQQYKKLMWAQSQAKVDINGNRR